MSEYSIILPRKNLHHDPYEMFNSYPWQCLYCLPSIMPNVQITVDDGRLDQKTRTLNSFSYYNCFLINDHLFAINASDFPTKDDFMLNIKKMSACFVPHYRRSYKPIFEKSPVPIFMMTNCLDHRMASVIFEHSARSKSFRCAKDISVFYCGKTQHRPAERNSSGKLISANIPHAVMLDRGMLSSEQYFNYMMRTKIAWCPKTVNDEGMNNTTGPREMEAMCLESLVVRPPIGITETEPRIEGIHYVEVKSDNSDLIETLQYYLENKEARKRIAHNGRLWWERNSSISARAKHIFKKAISVIS